MWYLLPSNKTEPLVPENTCQGHPVNQTHPHPTRGSEEATRYYLEKPCGSNQGQEETKSMCLHFVNQKPDSKYHEKLRARSLRL